MTAIALYNRATPGYEDRVANALRSLGVGTGDRVAIQLQNTVEFVRAFMAITKAGGIAVPVNTRLAPDEIAYLLADCAPKAVFISDETREVFKRAAAIAKNVLRIAAGVPKAGEHAIADLIGSMDGLPADLSARKKEYLRTMGYGQKRPR